MMSVRDEIISVGKIHTVGGAAIAGVDRLKIDNSTHLGSTGSIISDNGVGIRFSGRSDLDSWGLDVENKGTIGGIIGI